MALGFLPTFSPRLSEVQADSEGVNLLRECENLDQLATHIGVAPLSSFADSREVPDDFDGDPDELDEIMGEWDEWFAVEDGLETLLALKQALTNHADIAQYFRKPKDLVEELAEFERVLILAQEKGAKFRLEVG